jgi:hypothetical protein
MEDVNKLFSNAIDNEFSKNPAIAGDGFNYKRMINNENSSRDKKIITLIDIEKKHNKTKDSTEYINFLKKQLRKGAAVEKEHTDNVNIAKKIAKDHLWEDPNYYTKLAKMETKEATSSGSSGGYVAPLFPNLESMSEACWKGYRRVGGKMKNGKMVPNCVPIKENVWTEVNFKPIFNEAKVEAKEATTSSSTGSYEVPGMWAKSMRKKDWGGKKKTQIPGGKFVQIKKKCLKYPYCNQGDIGAIKLTEQNKTAPQKSGTWNPFSLFNGMINSITPTKVKKVSLIFPLQSWEFFVNKIFKALGIVTGIFTSLNDALKFVQTLKSQNVKVDELIIGSHGKTGTLLMTQKDSSNIVGNPYSFDNSFLEGIRGIIHNRSRVFFTACHGADFLDGLKDAAEKLGTGVYGSAGIYNPVTNQSEKGFYYCSPKQIPQSNSSINPIQVDKYGYISLHIKGKYEPYGDLPYVIKFNNSVFGVAVPPINGQTSDNYLLDTNSSPFRKDGEEIFVFDFLFLKLVLDNFIKSGLDKQIMVNLKKMGVNSKPALINYLTSKINSGEIIFEVKLNNGFVNIKKLEKIRENKQINNKFLLTNKFCTKVDGSPISWLSNIFNY